MTVLSAAITLTAAGLCLVLAAFAVRRLALTLTLARGQPPFAEMRQCPDVLVLVPARTERAALPGLAAALDALDYPAEQLRVVLIDDGSTDDTGRVMAGLAAPRRNWRVLSLPQNVGKPQALNLALAAYAFGEIVYILDVDHRPLPGCLHEVVRAFADPRVAGVSGRTVPRNGDASPAAFYATVEALVHQLITMRGKDVLGLGPALLGSNNAYRRSALMEFGGFRPGAFLEDSDLTLALYRAGYIVRYAPTAIATLQVPFTVAGYVKQHIRWGRGFHDVARAHLPALVRDARLPWRMRAELVMFALGYLDRLALLALAAVLILAGALGLGLAWTLAVIGLALGLGLPLVQIMAALAFDHAPLGMWLRLPYVPVFFALDAGTAVWSLALTVLNRPRLWTQTERAADA